MTSGQPLSLNAKKTLRAFVLTDLENEIDEAQQKIANLRIAGNHAEAERKRVALRFFWELWNELNEKITNLENP